MITVKLLAVLKEYAPDDGIVKLEYTPGMTVADAIAKTDVENTDIKYSLLVNNARKNPEDVLEDGDTVMVMPLLAGG